MKKLHISVCLLLVVFILMPKIMYAQEKYQYPVKFICGKSDGTILSRGIYKTAINVHNPTDIDTVIFKKKIALAHPGRQGRIIWLREGALTADGALEIDCNEIREYLLKQHDYDPELIKGFVVIESDGILDVVAVYTVRSGGRWCGSTSLEIERVMPNVMQR